MTTMNLIELTYGSQTFDTTSAKIACFCMLPGNKIRVFPSTVMNERVRNSNAASIDGHKLHGYWTNARYDLVEGMVLMIQVTNSVRAARRNNASMLIALRDSAPSLLVQARIVPHRNAVFNSINAFAGNGDIISPSEAEELGYVLDRGYVDTFFHPEEVEEVFDVTELSPGTDRPEIIEIRSVEGESVKVLGAPKPKRRVVVKRRK